MTGWVLFCKGNVRVILLSPEVCATWAQWSANLERKTRSTRACANFTHRAQIVADTRGRISEDVFKHEGEQIYAIRAQSIRAYGWLDSVPEHGSAFLICHMVQKFWRKLNPGDLKRAIIYRDKYRQFNSRKNT